MSTSGVSKRSTGEQKSKKRNEDQVAKTNSDGDQQEDEQPTDQFDYAALQRAAFSKGGVLLLIILLGILFVGLRNYDQKPRRRIHPSSSEQTPQSSEEVLSEQEKQILQSDLVFEVELDTIGVLQQHNPFVAVLFHRGDLSEEIESSLKAVAKSIAEQRIASKSRQILFTTARVTAENQHELRENGILCTVEQPQLVVLAKSRVIEAPSNTVSSQTLMEQFVQSATTRTINEITTSEQLAEFLEDKQHKRVLIGTNNSTLIDLFKEKERRDDVLSANGIAHVKLITNEQLLLSGESVSVLGLPVTFPFIAFLKDNRSPYSNEVSLYSDGPIDSIEEVKEFISVETLDLVYELNSQNYLEVFGSPVVNQIHLFVDGSQDNQAITKVFHEAALFNKEQELKYERMVFVVHTHSEDTREFMNLFDVESKAELPMITMSVLDYSSFGFMKYIMESPATATVEDIIAFGENARKKAIPQHYRSEPLPDESQSASSSILKLVGKNFKDTVTKTPFSYFILFHDSKNPEATEEYSAFLKEFIEQVPAEEYKHLLKIATFDLNKNEVEYLNIDSAPKLVVYPQFYKLSPQGYKGPLKVETISKFLNQWVRDLNIGGTKEKPAAAAASTETPQPIPLI